MEYVINIETNNGEGLVFIEDIEGEYPLYDRVYTPFIDKDEWPLELMGKSKTLQEFSNWFYKRENTRIISLMVAKSFKKATEYIDLLEEKAVDKAIALGKECRVVMRDGIGEPIGPGLIESRLNIWVAKNLVYRAEYF